MTIRNLVQPGGSSTQFQYNNAGLFGGISGLIFGGTDITHSAGLFRNNDNIYTTFGTSDIWSVYSDGTNFIIERNSGAGVVKLGASMDKDIRLNKIGLGGTVISASYAINYIGSGNARGAMSFDYTTTGTNIISDMFLKVTSQRTNNSPNYAILTQTIKDEDKQSSYYGISCTWGTTGTRSITTAGTVTFVGFNADHSLGVGTANTTGDIRQYGLRILPFTAYTGVASQVDWGIYSGEDIALASDKKLILEGSATTKGDSYFIFNAASTDMDNFIDGTKTMTWDNDLIETFVPFKVAGVTLGTVIHTITTPATNDDPTEFIQQNRVTTTDATVTTLDTYTIPASTTVNVITHVVARRTGGSAGTAEDGAGYCFATTVKNVAGTATIIAGPTALFAAQESQAGWNATHDVTAATLRTRVTGAINNNVTWHCTSRIYQVGS